MKKVFQSELDFVRVPSRKILSGRANIKDKPRQVSVGSYGKGLHAVLIPKRTIFTIFGYFA
jgi:hypothetical protein